MHNIAKKLMGLLHALPAIILSTLIQVFIGFAVGRFVMDLLMPTSLGHDHRYVVLVLATLSVVVAYAWMRWNNLVRQYIETRSD
jgi:uncharacterized membrane protein